MEIKFLRYNLFKKLFKLRNFGAWMTRWPLIGPVLERVLFNRHRNGDKLFYLPKDRVVIDQRIDDHESVIVPSEVVAHFIEKAGHIFLMDACLCREADGCQVYDHSIGCIFLGEAVLDISPKLGRLVDKETALAHLERARKAGLVHMIGRDRFDAVLLGVKHELKLMTICNCCSCCCLYRVLPKLSPKLQHKVERMPGVVVEVTENCVGCGICTHKVCFIDAIHLENGRAIIGEDCRGCGNCVDACEQGAIRVVIEDHAYIDKAILRLTEAVDVD